ncbi:hypothetical protein BX070DRAFT_222104 [Coemansia spiralis]|nr:hypothetical protein BX070DRAFT_222104 [Coemansia spiralis]
MGTVLLPITLPCFYTLGYCFNKITSQLFLPDLGGIDRQTAAGNWELWKQRQIFSRDKKERKRGATPFLALCPLCCCSKSMPK